MQAFNYIFPPITAQQLLKITECIRDLTAKLWISDETAAKLEKTFEGLFSIIAIGTDALGSLIKGIAHALLNFNGFHIGILDGTAAIGEWLVNLRSSIKEAAVTGSLLALSLSIQMMSGCVSGAVALSVACTSLFSLFGVLALMSKLSWEGIIKRDEVIL